MFNRDEIFGSICFEKPEDVIMKLKNATNPNFQDDKGLSYLHMACQKHNVEVIKVLLEMGANPNINDNRGVSPILEAIGSINANNNEILELMLQYGLDLNKMEGDLTLKEQIESFHEDEMDKIVKKYCKKSD